MKAVILAAGKGTRLKSKHPKVLHEVGGKPLLAHVIAAATKVVPAKDVFAIIGHEADRVRSAVAASGVGFVVQPEQRGTGHALMVAREALAPYDLVIVLYGDAPLITSKTIEQLRDFHSAKKAAMTILTARLENPAGYGRIVRRKAGSDDVKAIVEQKDLRPPQRKIHEVNSGFYAFDGKQLFSQIEKLGSNNHHGEFYLTEVFLHLRPVTIVRISDPDEAIGVKDRVKLAAAGGLMSRRILEQIMLGGVTIVDPESTFIDADVTIGQDTVIEPFSVIKGKTVIGQECRIGPHVHIEDARIGDRSDCGPFAKLRPGTEIGDDVHIGSFAELVRTKVGRGSRVPHVSYLGDTDLGEDANIGAGTITANYDGVNKNPTVIGDGSFVGVDTMLVAPVKLGKGSRTGAGSVVTKDVPDGATAVGVPARVIRRKPVDADPR
jgi:bifunctional UDP-N-acetylglucosamine pyrophosphorylase/glucosamine-1-phosphate N-acetyltransferase